MMSKSESIGQCGCGRSPTGKCIGWHALTEEAYQTKLAVWTLEHDESDMIEREKAINAELEEYRQQAMKLWFDNGGSCTGARPGTPNIK